MSVPGSTYPPAGSAVLRTVTSVAGMMGSGGSIGCLTLLVVPSGSLPVLESQSIWNLAWFSTVPVASSLTVTVNVSVLDSPFASEMPVHSRRPAFSL